MPPKGKLNNKNTNNGIAKNKEVWTINQSSTLLPIKNRNKSWLKPVKANNPFIPSIKFIPLITIKIEKTKKR